MPPEGKGALLPIAAYGSLRPGGEGYRLFNLDKHAIPMGPCGIVGRLRMIDGYPALTSGSDTIKATLMMIDKPGLLARIDAWEGPNYRRSRTRLADGTSQAWVWHWAGDVVEDDDMAGRIIGGIIDVIDVSLS